MGQLVLVATPIGHLEDISARALRTLSEADLILAEDTRITRRLLARYAIRTPLAAFHAHSTPSRLAAVVAGFDGRTVAYVTDAGMPGISDPGAELVAAALAAGHAVSAVPGPSAVTTAVAIAGLGGDGFTFLGFLPRRGSERRARLAAAASIAHPLVLFEAPHRLVATLADLEAVLGDRAAVACRELSKLHEDVVRGTLGALRAQWSEREPRGEFTLVIAGAPPAATQRWDADAVREALAARRARGAGRREASREVARAAGWTARDAYRLWDGADGGATHEEPAVPDGEPPALDRTRET